MNHEQKRDADEQIRQRRLPDGIGGGQIVVGLENACGALRSNGLVQVLVEGLDVADLRRCGAGLLCFASVERQRQRIALQNKRLDPFGFKQVEHVGICKPAAVLRKQGRREHHKHQRQDRNEQNGLQGFGLLVHGGSPLCGIDRLQRS